MTSSPTAAAPLRPVRDGAVPLPDGPPPPRPPRPMPGDGELMTGSLAEPELFATVFDRHAVAVHGYLARRVGELADDLLSETFLIAFRRRAAYRAVHAEVRPWLLGIATNVLHAHHRAERRRYRALARAAGRRDEQPADPGESADRLSAQALRGPLAEALAGLAARDRDVLLLVAWGELSYEEVAAVLDVPVGTVRSRLHRARRRTRAALAPARGGRRVERRRRHRGTGRPLGPPPGSVSLVAFRPPTFPLALDPAPAGLTPSYSEDPGNVLIAGWRSTDGADGITLRMTPDEPDLVRPSDEQDVTVRGRDGVLATEHIPYAEGRTQTSAALVLEWHDGQWVELTGAGRFASRQQLLAVARTIVDRILTLVDDAYDQQTLNVYLPERPIPSDELLHQLAGAVGPFTDATVNGRPAQLVRIAGGPIDSGWFLQAQFPDGRTFVVQAPKAFTQDQVLAFAAQVTYTS